MEHHQINMKVDKLFKKRSRRNRLSLSPLNCNRQQTEESQQDIQVMKNNNTTDLISGIMTPGDVEADPGIDITQYIVNSKGPVNVNKIFDDVPITRKVLHNQSIIFKERVAFDIELSFEKNKFYILIIKRLIPYQVTKKKGQLVTIVPNS